MVESINNENFKNVEFENFENKAGKNSFYMSSQKWIKETNAIGVISKSVNNGGTFAHADIADKWNIRDYNDLLHLIILIIIIYYKESLIY